MRRLVQGVGARRDVAPSLAWELTKLAAPDIAERFGDPRVRVESGSLVDPEFRSHQTDLLIRLERDADEALVYVLYEHKSAPDRWVSLQLLRYLGAIWHRSRPPRVVGRLPQIVPVVIYHGSRRWTSSLGFVVAVLALKFVRQRLTEAIAHTLVAALDRALADPGARGLGRQAERLYLITRSRSDIELMATVAADREYHRAQESLMTYAEELLREGRLKGREEGHQEGREEGRQEGRREGELQDKRAVLLRLLSRKFTVTDEDRGRVLSCDDPEALDAALDEIVTAEEIGSVLARIQ